MVKTSVKTICSVGLHSKQKCRINQGFQNFSSIKGLLFCLSTWQTFASSDLAKK